jgi:hypothetical protein
MKLILVLSFFAKFSFAYQLYGENDFNVTSSLEFHEYLCYSCPKFEDKEECPEELTDEDILGCMDDLNVKILYCEPPKILDENNECVSKISPEKWREVMENSTALWDFIYLNNMDEGKLGKFPSKKMTIENVHRNYFAVIGRTPEGEYKMFNLRTCFHEVGERNLGDIYNEAGFLDLCSMVKLSTPQLVSIIFFLLLLVFYLTIEELRKSVHGQCWINFLINSLINYLVAIFQLVYVQIDNKHSSYSPSYITIEVLIGLAMEIEYLTFIVSSTIVIYTEFSLYFWLNITFFEAFYMMR